MTDQQLTTPLSSRAAAAQQEWDERFRAHDRALAGARADAEWERLDVISHQLRRLARHLSFNYGELGWEMLARHLDSAHALALPSLLELLTPAELAEMLTVAGNSALRERLILELGQRPSSSEDHPEFPERSGQQR